jgi:hypothetical protein
VVRFRELSRPYGALEVPELLSQPWGRSRSRAGIRYDRGMRRGTVVFPLKTRSLADLVEAMLPLGQLEQCVKVPDQVPCVQYPQLVSVIFRAGD